MTTHILFAAKSERWPEYEAPLRAALDAEGVDYVLSCEMDAELVDYIIYAPNSGLSDFSVFPRLKAVMNLWAGVEDVVGNKTLTVPLTRMVDEEGLTQGMVEWVSGHVMRHHLGMDAHIVNPDRIWDDTPPPLAKDRKVTVLGLGALGTACAGMLAQIGFAVTGWSRSAKKIADVTCEHGDEGLARALSGAEIVVLLLPNTPATEDVINAERLALMAKGSVIINPGRGPLIDDAALLAALDSGQIGHATLDVFRVEPLPVDHPFWAHPKVTVTPHIASTTRPDSAARVIAHNIRRAETGAPLLHLVDRSAGY
ncbi:glyoxylate/hydroxypyruvate reductase A [Tropicibacter sp. R15_0]|uniref:2-hydroxyacid dehydrogenase n=1 Tax=Tropicibacter sp. R15_0 TaxID=2821101 RepID=UPI001ADBE2A9|nr:glyoxylate/hydroxypyruvate reductase A [Tropicibacter sp. R15_0]MBO9466253.1 glyoxylate/hydroxypyruvate reductase A [Tropicibacter sp. R15_0]